MESSADIDVWQQSKFGDIPEKIGGLDLGVLH